MVKGKAESLAYVGILQDPMIFMLYIYCLKQPKQEQDTT